MKESVKRMSTMRLTLLTDLYELTMMQGYFKNQTNETVVFDVFYRKNPSGSGFAIAAGLDQVIDYIKNLTFEPGDIEYLRSLKLLATSTRFRKAPSYFRGSPFLRSSPRLWKRSLWRRRSSPS